jgi:sugar phosphate permease
MTFAGGSTLFVVLIALLGLFLYAARSRHASLALGVCAEQYGWNKHWFDVWHRSRHAQAAAPIIGGLVADAFGLMAAFYFPAATILLANLMVFFIPAPATHSETGSLRPEIWIRLLPISWLERTSASEVRYLG